jgi:alpha-1,2-mannosyltransferase
LHNTINRQKLTLQVDPSSCTYLVSLHLPSKPPTALEPDYAEKPEWEREFCVPFLDQKSSKWWSRLGWLPAGLGSSGRVFGEYCLLKRK